MLKFAINNLTEKFPFVKSSVIGKSLCGRNIFALSIGNNKNKCLYAATFHGMEWFNTLILLSFFEELCAHYISRTPFCGTDVFKGLSHQGLMIIPCVNPDGVEIQLKGSSACPKYKGLIDSITKDTSHWQANARGVDLNHNFNAGWKALKALEIKSGITSPSPTRYGGKKPFSEPETIALRNLCLREKFTHSIAFHSQGREVYSSFGSNTPEKSLTLGKLFSDKSGYKSANPKGLAVGGGFKDWLIGYLKTPAITVETGLGENPLPVSGYMAEYKRIKRALAECLFIRLFDSYH